jgi:uncharacterized phage-associated protein
MSRLTYGVDQVARFILSLTDPEDNDVSNLKLQKLCYYAQGLCTAMRGAPLFRERLEAWDHGPVVPDLYHQYKQYGAQPIPAVTDFDLSELEDIDRQALSDVYDYYAQFSAWRLRNMTHEEAPWINASKRHGREISVEALVEYFSQQVDNDYSERVYGG